MKLRSAILLSLLLVWGCKPAQQTQTTQGGSYYEDLSGVRPKVEAVENTTEPEKTKRDPKAYVEAHYTINKQLDAVLDSIDRINLTRKFVEGYAIQVYSGLKREDALNVRKQLTQSIPQLDSELQYVQPNFRVKTGKYFTRLEAEKDYEQVRRYFPAAIVVPDKIAIN
jgi:hypothetical protein